MPAGQYLDPEYMKKYNKARRAEQTTAASRRAEQRKLAWFKENGPCTDCGTWENLEVHHEFPERKTASSRAIWDLGDERRNAELENCIVLCSSCHDSLTAIMKNSKTFEHGTRSMYQRGCRCSPCKTANAIHERERKQSKRLKNGTV